MFTTFIEHADFLYTWGSSVEYHVCYYSAAASIALDVITAVLLFLQEEVGPPRSSSRRAAPKTEPHLFYEDDAKGVYHHHHNNGEDVEMEQPCVMSSSSNQSDDVVTEDVKRQLLYQPHDTVFNRNHPMTSSLNQGDCSSAPQNCHQNDQSPVLSRCAHNSAYVQDDVEVDDVDRKDYVYFNPQFSTIEETEEE